MRHEIARADWETFFETFSRKNRGRLAHIEVTAPLGEGGLLLEEDEPLQCVALGPDDGVHEIILALGGSDSREPRLAHVITDPAHVWVEGEAYGIDRGMVIGSVEGDETRLFFQSIGAPHGRPLALAGAAHHRGRDRLPPERP